MSNSAKPNYSINFNYMLECLNIRFTASSYKSGKTIPGLSLGFSTLKQVLSGNGPIKKSGKVVSEKKIQEIAAAFSLLLKQPEEKRITAEDLDLNPDDFASKFPPSAFIQNTKNHHTVDMAIFTNKLYRGYYMMPNYPRKAFYAYFKLVEKDSAYEAWLVRGIPDFSLAQDIRNNFDSFNHLEQCIREKSGGKETESIHLYHAQNINTRGNQREDIRITQNCIKIDFRSTEDTPCHTTMYWNICIPVGMQLTTYIGGSTLMVDTNDGKRGKNICAFKMGLEAIEDIPSSQQAIVDQGPFVNDSQELISELTLESYHGLMALDNSDDNQWYRFIQGDSYREKVYDRYADVDVKKLVTDLVRLRADYRRELNELKELVKAAKEEGKNKQNGDSEA